MKIIYVKDIHKSKHFPVLIIGQFFINIFQADNILQERKEEKGGGKERGKKRRREREKEKKMKERIKERKDEKKRKEKGRRGEGKSTAAYPKN